MKTVFKRNRQEDFEVLDRASSQLVDRGFHVDEKNYFDLPAQFDRSSDVDDHKYFLGSAASPSMQSSRALG